MRRPIALLLPTLLFALVYGCESEPLGGGDEFPIAVPGGVVDGIDTLTGLVARGDYLLVKGNCLACHSSQLILQQRATTAGWTEILHWMTKKQGMPDLGKHEAPIVEYLATYYAPRQTGRRAPLLDVEWYELE